MFTWFSGCLFETMTSQAEVDDRRVGIHGCACRLGCVICGPCFVSRRCDLCWRNSVSYRATTEGMRDRLLVDVVKDTGVRLTDLGIGEPKNTILTADTNRIKFCEVTEEMLVGEER